MNLLRNKKKNFLHVLAALMILVMTVGISCSSASDNPFTEEELIPEKVLAEIPVYPDAMTISAEESGFKPFSTPLAPQSDGRPPEIVYDTVSVQYTIEDKPETILKWYRSKLGRKGYQIYSEMTYNGPDGNEVKSIGFYRPEVTLVSVEIHACDTAERTVFAVIVNRDTTTPVTPPELQMSEDIVSISGFRLETSIPVPIDTHDETYSILTIDNEGTASFVKLFHEDRFSTLVPEYRPEFYRVTVDGSRDELIPGVFIDLEISHNGGYFFAVDENNNVFFIEKDNLKIIEYKNPVLAGILKTSSNPDVFGNQFITHLLVSPSTTGTQKYIGLYNVETGNDTAVVLDGNYVWTRGLDYDGEKILIEALPDMSHAEPPDYYVIDTEGNIRIKVEPKILNIQTVGKACLVYDGLIIYGGENITSNDKLMRFSDNGSLVWSTPVELSQIKISSIDDETLAVSGWNENEGYIGYFSAYNGSIISEYSFYKDRQLQIIDITGSYYLLPESSEYHGTGVPIARINRYDNGKESAFVDIPYGIYYFAASPNGKFFAVVTRNRLSIFSYTE